MGCSSRVLLPPLLLLVLLILPNAGDAAWGKPGSVGSYQPILDPSDSEIKVLAEFALTQHDKDSGERLNLTRVLGGQERYDEGIHYRLIIGAAGPDRVENLYLAMVSKTPWMTLQLTAFNLIV